MNESTTLLSAEDKRLARLKIFCEAIGFNFFAAKEIVAKVVNDSAYSVQYFSPQEIQDRFIYCKNHDISCYLGEPNFWDFVRFIDSKK